MRRALLPALVLALALLAPAAAQAEAWTQVASGLPLRPLGVNESGTVVGRTPTGELARISRGGGLVLLGTGDARCSFVQDAGIADDGTVLATASCGDGSRSFAFGPTSTIGSSAGLDDVRIAAVAGDGRFVGTRYDGGTGVAIVGTASAGVVGTTPIRGTYAEGIDPAGDTLTSAYAPADGSLSVLVNGSARASFVVRAEDDGPLALLPDASFILRQRGQPISVVGSGGSRSPLALRTAAGSVVEDAGLLGGSNAGARLFGLTTGPGLPAGESGIVAWADPTQPARLLPILTPTTPPAQPVEPVAVSGDGAWLALSDGQLWFDPDAVARVTPVDPAVQAAIAEAEQPRPVVTPPPGTRLANPSPAVKEVARGEQRYWDRQALRAGLDAGQFVSATTGGVAPAATSSQAQIALAVYAAFQQRVEFWSTVALDPPDPQWRTTASAPAVRIARLTLAGIRGTQRSALRAQLEGQLRLAAAERCAADAINRGATAMAAGQPSVAAAQYGAGSSCLRTALPIAAALPASAARAATALRVQRRAARRRSGGARPKAKAYGRGVDASLRRLVRVVALSPAAVADLRAALLRGATPKAATPDLGTSLTALARRSAEQVAQLRGLADELDAAAAGR